MLISKIRVWFYFNVYFLLVGKKPDGAWPLIPPKAFVNDKSEKKKWIWIVISIICHKPCFFCYYYFILFFVVGILKTHLHRYLYDLKWKFFLERFEKKTQTWQKKKKKCFTYPRPVERQFRSSFSYHAAHLAVPQPISWFSSLVEDLLCDTCKINNFF